MLHAPQTESPLARRRTVAGAYSPARSRGRRDARDLRPVFVRADDCGGSDVGNAGGIEAEPLPYMGLEHSLVLTLPPLGGVVLAPG
jgi:hypothetical protein